MARPPPDVTVICNNLSELNKLNLEKPPTRVLLARSLTLEAETNPAIRTKIKTLISKNINVAPVVGRNSNEYVAPPKQNPNQYSKPLTGYRLRQLSTNTFTKAVHLNPRPRPLNGVVATVFGPLSVVGWSVIQQLTQFGAQVLCPVQSNYYGTDYTGVGDWRNIKMLGDQGQVVPVVMDLTSTEEIARCVERSQIVYNLLEPEVPRVNWTIPNNQEALLTNIPRNIARACTMKGVQRFVHVTNVNSDPSSDINTFKFMGLGEQAVKDEFPNSIILRPTDIFNWRDVFTNFISNSLPSTNLFFQGRTISLLKDREYVKCQPVWSNDLARAIVRASMREKAFGRTYTLGGPQVYYLIEVIRYIESLRAMPPSRIRLMTPLEAKLTLYNRPGKELLAHWVDVHLRQDSIVPEGAESWKELDIDPSDLVKMEDVVPDWLVDETYHNIPQIDRTFHPTELGEKPSKFRGTMLAGLLSTIAAIATGAAA